MVLGQGLLIDRKMLAVQKHSCFECFLEVFAALGFKKLMVGTLVVFASYGFISPFG